MKWAAGLLTVSVVLGITGAALGGHVYRWELIVWQLVALALGWVAYVYARLAE